MQQDEPTTWWKPCYSKPVQIHRYLRNIPVKSMTHIMENLMRQWIPDFTCGWTCFWALYFGSPINFFNPWTYCLIRLALWITQTWMHFTAITKNVDRFLSLSVLHIFRNDKYPHYVLNRILIQVSLNLWINLKN